MNEKLVLTDESTCATCGYSWKTGKDALVALVKLTDKAKAETAKLVEECDEDIISAQRRENKLKEEVESLKGIFREELKAIETGDQNIRLTDAKAHRAKINYLKEENAKLQEQIDLNIPHEAFVELKEENTKLKEELEETKERYKRMLLNKQIR